MEARNKKYENSCLHFAKLRSKSPRSHVVSKPHNIQHTIFTFQTNIQHSRIILKIWWLYSDAMATVIFNLKPQNMVIRHIIFIFKTNYIKIGTSWNFGKKSISRGKKHSCACMFPFCFVQNTKLYHWTKFKVPGHIGFRDAFRFLRVCPDKPSATVRYARFFNI